MAKSEKAEKKAFIEGKLLKVINEATKGAVVELRYETLNDYDEVVTIVYNNGYTRQARVTGDSKWGCMTDVIRAVNY